MHEEKMPPVEAESRATEFKRAFAETVKLVREEWPTLDDAALLATEGNLDEVAALLAKHLDRTKLAARRHLLELMDIATSGRSDQARLGGALNGKAKAEGAAGESPKRETLQVDEVIAAIRRLESFAADEAKRVSGKMIPMAETKVRQNLWVSLLCALGLGMIVGLWLNGGRKQR